MPEAEVKWKRGELAEACGVNSETLRFYEKAGLLNPERGPNGYRLYGVSDAKRIRLAQRAGQIEERAHFVFEKHRKLLHQRRLK